MLPRIGLLPIVFAVATGCVTGGKDKSDTNINITDTSEQQLELVAANFVQGTDTYQFNETSQTVEWFACKGKKSKATIVINHPDESPYTAEKFCDQWFAQVFLAAGFDVLGVNRPGNGQSTGAVDFSGPQSISAIKTALEKAPQVAQFPKQINGMWGYSAGATAAALASRGTGIKFLILGGGFYDLEQTKELTTSSHIKGLINQVLTSEGDAGIEFRSVGWDPSNLPQHIILYHGKNDLVSPEQQAATFRDSLASSEYKVTLEIIDGIAHKIPWVHHQKIVQVMAAAAPE